MTVQNEDSRRLRILYRTLVPSQECSTLARLPLLNPTGGQTILLILLQMSVPSLIRFET